MCKVISFSGHALSGKTTSAEILREFLEEDGFKVCLINYADLLKFYAKQYFGWDGKKDFNGRSLLQILGTERVRYNEPNYWVDSVIGFTELFKNDFDYFLISDARFANELERWRDYKISIIKVLVERLNFDNGLSPEQKNHASEIALDNYKYFDWEIISESGVDNLRKEVEMFYQANWKVDYK
jgi:hypothetical protein